MCVDNLTIICSDYGLAPGRRQAIIWILFTVPLKTNFSKILNEIHIFCAFKKIDRKMVAILSPPQCVNHRFIQYNEIIPSDLHYGPARYNIITV